MEIELTALNIPLCFVSKRITFPDNQINPISIIGNLFIDIYWKFTKFTENEVRKTFRERQLDNPNEKGEFDRSAKNL